MSARWSSRCRSSRPSPAARSNTCSCSSNIKSAAPPGQRRGYRCSTAPSGWACSRCRSTTRTRICSPARSGEPLRGFASLLGELIMTKTMYGDSRGAAATHGRDGPGGRDAVVATAAADLRLPRSHRRSLAGTGLRSRRRHHRLRRRSRASRGLPCSTGWGTACAAHNWQPCLLPPTGTRVVAAFR